MSVRPLAGVSVPVRSAGERQTRGEILEEVAVATDEGSAC